MNISKKSVVTLLTAATFALGAGVASAGGHQKGGWGGCDGYGHPGMYERNLKQEDFKERMAARHERLKKALKLDAKQEADWKTFTDQMAALAQEQSKKFDPDQFLGLSTPEKMEKRLELSRQAQDAMAKRLTVVKTFYNSLTAEQKKKFDDWHSPKGQRGGPRGR